MNKKKILMLSDHPLSTSGVGCQARFLIDGLLATGKYSFRCFGAALKHTNYETVVINEDFIIKPLDGFGTKEMLRVALATEKPDALFFSQIPDFLFGSGRWKKKSIKSALLSTGMFGIMTRGHRIIEYFTSLQI